MYILLSIVTDPMSEFMDGHVISRRAATPRDSDRVVDTNSHHGDTTADNGGTASRNGDRTRTVSPSEEETVAFSASQKSAFAKVNRVTEDTCTWSHDYVTTKPEQTRLRANVFPTARHGAVQRPTLLPPTLLQSINFNKRYQGEYGGAEHWDVGRLLAGDVARMSALGGRSLANLQLMTYRDPRLPITNYWLYLSKLFANAPLPSAGTTGIAVSPTEREAYPQFGAGVFFGSGMTSRVHDNTDHRRNDSSAMNNMAASSRQQSFDAPKTLCTAAHPRDVTSLPLTCTFTPNKCDVIETEARPLPGTCGTLRSPSVTSSPLHFHVRRPEVDPGAAPSTKKYKCDLCGKAFSRSNTLVTHRVSSRFHPLFIHIIHCSFAN